MDDDKPYVIKNGETRYHQPIESGGNWTSRIHVVDVGFFKNHMYNSTPPPQKKKKNKVLPKKKKLGFIAKIPLMFTFRKVFRKACVNLHPGKFTLPKTNIAMENPPF